MGLSGMTMLFAAIAIGLAGPAAGTAGESVVQRRGSASVSDDWDELYSVMENMLSVMDAMDQQWSATMGNTITQIGAMADRIV